MAVQLVEELPSDDLAAGVERWLVHDGEIAPRIALLADDKEDLFWRAIGDHFEPWIGVTHAAFAAHLASGRARDRRLMVVHEDDRGPTLATAAGWIASPLDRERWAAAQIASLCDGISSMGTRQRGFVHRRAGDPRTFVDAGGNARLRAYLAPGLFRADAGRGPFFLSPEQISMNLLTPTSDVFQLALTLYLALDGTHPFSRGEHGDDRLRSILEDPTPPPPRTTSPQLGQIIQMALAKRPEDRFDPVTFAAILRQHVPPVAPSVYDEVASALRSARG
jgi:hypothetical protein